MIVATAGHIDHGKTALVKALTGTDADRLPEEKARGLSIDLGFAYAPLPDGTVLGFVDVPGHERFIRNMLAGVTGIDHALLVIAADDGPMPQTEEHLAILDLLGVRSGVVAVTKIDRVDEARVREVSRMTEDLLAHTVLAGAPIVPVSGLNGEGIPALRGHLELAAGRARARASGGHFRLAIDRAFTVPGAGLVVTGTVFSGTVRTDETVILSPRGTPVRVRAIHAQNREAAEARAAQRSALNITAAGLEKGHVHRGDWLLAEAVHQPTPRLDVRIRLLASEVRPLKHWTPVHVHIGAADVTGRVAVLGARDIQPGAEALAQLVLDHALGALRGDRCILRDQSARRTIAGGRVIDPFAPSRGRARPDRLAALAAMEKDDPADALRDLLRISAQGVELGRIARAWNLAPEQEARLWERVPMVRAGRPGSEIAIAPERQETLKAHALEALARWHQSTPDRMGPGEEALRASLTERVPAAIFGAVVRDLVDEGALVSGGMFLRLPGHAPVMTPADQRMWEQLRPILENGHTKPAVLHEIAGALAREPEVLRRFLNRAAGLGAVVMIAANRFMLPGAAAELAHLAEAMAAEPPDGVIIAAAFRDRSGIGRNLTIQVLEFFDRAGFTRRTGDVRRVLKPAQEVFGPSAT